MNWERKTKPERHASPPIPLNLRYLLKKLLQLQALTEGEPQAAVPSHSSTLPLAYGVASSVGTIQGTGPSTGAEEPFGKKSKKEKKEKGKENNKLEGILRRQCIHCLSDYTDNKDLVDWLVDTGATCVS